MNWEAPSVFRRGSSHVPFTRILQETYFPKHPPKRRRKTWFNF
ncbi:MAG: hypothetical protein V7K25_15760 [Nostoc sp.]